MDTDCLICCGSHHSKECSERKPEHCEDCHAFINNCSDHTSVCSQKTWIFKKFEKVYAKPVHERCIIAMNTPFRLLKDGCWRKANEGMEMISPEIGAFFSFKSDRDLSFSTSSFVPMRIIIVVKDKSGIFAEKLMLLTCKKQVIVATEVNKAFDRIAAKGTHEWCTSLILAVSAIDNPSITINVFPTNKPVRKHDILYDLEEDKFYIPEDLSIAFIQHTSNDMYHCGPEMFKPQLNQQSIDGAQCLELIERSRIVAPNRQRKIETRNTNTNTVDCLCYGAHHSTECGQRKLTKCFECHTPVNNTKDHAHNCGVKNWFLSRYTDVYVKIPAIRCIISFQTPIYFQLNGRLYMAGPEMKLLSFAADSYFKFESNKKVILSTTGFSRIRIPIIIQETNGSVISNMEKLVLLTSHDRTIVAAKGSRHVNYQNVLNDFEHNTPLVLYALSKDAGVSIDVYSSGGMINSYQIAYSKATKKFEVPRDLDVKSTIFSLKEFDAVIPKR